MSSYSELVKNKLMIVIKNLEHFKTLGEYRLIAVDGPDLQIPHDLNNQETYFQSTPNSKGFN
jgi:hypothetical protein